MAKFDNLSLENKNKVRKVLEIILNAVELQGNEFKPSVQIPYKVFENEGIQRHDVIGIAKKLDLKVLTNAYQINYITSTTASAFACPGAE